MINSSQTQEALLENNEKKTVEVKDSSVKAIIAINIFCMVSVGVATSWKYIALEGVSILVYWFYRSMFTLILASIDLFRKGINPMKALPSENNTKVKLLLRIIFGNTTFFLFNLSLPLVPIFIARILL